MHLGNGAITAECAFLTLGAAAAGLGLAAVDLRRNAPSRSTTLLAAGLGGLVFAAQAINVTVLPDSSAHLVGGVLLAWALGPSLGAWTMALILAVQALLMGDGGGLALGANVLNMALLPALLVFAARRWQGAGSPAWREYAAAGVIAAVAVPVAAGLIALETFAFRSADELVGWNAFALQMLLIHLWIGVGEGLLTAALVAALAWFHAKESSAAWRPSAALLGIGLGLVAIALPLASELPDGYEASAEKSGMASFLAEDASELAAISSLHAKTAIQQQRIVAAFENVLPGEQALVALAMILTAGATLLVAIGLSRVPVPVRR